MEYKPKACSNSWDQGFLGIIFDRKETMEEKWLTHSINCLKTNSFRNQRYTVKRKKKEKEKTSCKISATLFPGSAVLTTLWHV